MVTPRRKPRVSSTKRTTPNSYASPRRSMGKASRIKKQGRRITAKERLSSVKSSTNWAASQLGSSFQEQAKRFSQFSDRLDGNTLYDGFSASDAKESLRRFNATLAKPLFVIPRAAKPITITRRAAVVFGAGLVAAGIGTNQYLSAKEARKKEAELGALTVSKDQVFTRQDCQEVPLDQNLKLIGNLRLPSGSLIFSNSNKVASALIPSKQPHPLRSLSMINFSSAQANKLLGQAINHDAGFDLFDARVSESHALWLEVNVMENTWKLLGGSLSSGLSKSAQELCFGDGAWEYPSLALVGSMAFWQCVPQSASQNNKKDAILSSVRAFDLTQNISEPCPPDADVAKDERVHLVLTSKAHPACGLYAAKAGVVATPNAEKSRSAFTLSYIDAKTLEVNKKLTLPAGMKPQEVGWGPTGFAFGFESIYNFGDGISNLGTYVCSQAADNYSDPKLAWFRYDATPQGPSCWCGRNFMVKGKYVVAGVDPKQQTVFATNLENNTQNWGEYLASTGDLSNIVTVSEISNPNDKSKGYCSVRIWAATPGANVETST